ncbi:glycosyltransferase family 2 protein [Actinomycetospora flava]|uniref:Glycosyltransferase family 2 protein n=1 Tax=Actinomycetospora flava TaxID=3129232 RepID=A0ABU8MAG2_9PSEU
MEPTVTVVIPARNEADNLRELLPRLSTEHEVLVVDGHSTDETAHVVRRVRPDARLITQTRRGKGNALVCGMTAATGDAIVLVDADGSADPGEIPRFVDALADADVATGSRTITGGGSHDLTQFRAAGNRMLTGLANLAVGSRASDLCYGYNALWRDVLPALGLPDVDARSPFRLGDGFEIEAFLHCRSTRAGLRVAEVPSVELARHHGASNLHSVKDGLRVLAMLLAEGVERPLGASAPPAQQRPLTPRPAPGRAGTRRALRRAAHPVVTDVS